MEKEERSLGVITARNQGTLRKQAGKSRGNHRIGRRKSEVMVEPSKQEMTKLKGSKSNQICLHSLRSS